MSIRDIQLHLDDLYGYELSTQTISNITQKVIEKANEWPCACTLFEKIDH